jgi:hypothetical protein
MSWDAEGRYYPVDSATKPLIVGSEQGKKLPHDPNFKGITVEGRKWNDLLFGLLFVLMFAAMLVISSVAFHKGDPSQLLTLNELEQKYKGQVEDKADYWFQDGVAHLKRDVDVLAGALAIAFVLGIVWIQLMKMFTKIFIYLTLILGILGVVALGFAAIKVGMVKVSWVIFAFAAILVLIVIFLRKRINLTAAMFTECCRGVQHNPGLFVVSSAMAGVLALFVVYWIASFIYLYSIPEDTVQLNPNLPPKFDQKIRNLMYFNVFGFFWTTALISAIFQVSVAGALATWYFSRDASSGYNSVGSPALRSLTWACTKSFGSLALGSLLLAVVQFINFLLNRARKANKNNKILYYIICCVQCLFSCVERIIKFIDRFAYIYIAMHGDSFCTAARNCYNLISRNLFSAVVVDLLGDFVLFVGKILGTAICTIFTVLLVDSLGREVYGLTVVAVVVISFAVFNLFAHIVGVGVDTVFVCYLEDLERNGDNGTLYIDPELHRMLQDRASDAKTQDRQPTN